MPETGRRKAADEMRRKGNKQMKKSLRMSLKGVVCAPTDHVVIQPIIERLRKFAEFRPERLDFEILELMRDAENAIVTEQEMHAAWRKRAEEAEQREDSALLEAAGLVCADCAKGLPSVKDTDGDWMHTRGDVNVWFCNAGPIHERRAQK